MSTPRRRKAVNITLSDRARAIAEVLAIKDGTSMSQLLDAMLVAELVRGGRLTEPEVTKMLARIRAEKAEGKAAEPE
jgi:hypothetical protein